MRRLIAAVILGAALVPTLAQAQLPPPGQPPPAPPPGYAQPAPPPGYAQPAPPPGYAQPAPPPGYAQPMAPAPMAPIAEEEWLPSHQISAGVGVPICAFAAIEGFAASGCVDDQFLWINIPVVYRYRINDYLAAGGGLMLNIFAIAEIAAVGAELLGSFRVYALPDYIYFDANVLLGFPFFAALMPTVGLALPIGNISIFLENQVALMYAYGFFGFWQPVLGVEFRF